MHLLRASLAFGLGMTVLGDAVYDRALRCRDFRAEAERWVKDLEGFEQKMLARQLGTLAGTSNDHRSSRNDVNPREGSITAPTTKAPRQTPAVSASKLSREVAELERRKVGGIGSLSIRQPRARGTETASEARAPPPVDQLEGQFRSGRRPQTTKYSSTAASNSFDIFNKKRKSKGNFIEGGDRDATSKNASLPSAGVALLEPDKLLSNTAGASGQGSQHQHILKQWPELHGNQESPHLLRSMHDRYMAVEQMLKKRGKNSSDSSSDASGGKGRKHKRRRFKSERHKQEYEARERLLSAAEHNAQKLEQQTRFTSSQRGDHSSSSDEGGGTTTTTKNNKPRLFFDSTGAPIKSISASDPNDSITEKDGDPFDDEPQDYKSQLRIKRAKRRVNFLVAKKRAEGPFGGQKPSWYIESEDDREVRKAFAFTDLEGQDENDCFIRKDHNDSTSTGRSMLEDGENEDETSLDGLTTTALQNDRSPSGSTSTSANVPLHLYLREMRMRTFASKEIACTADPPKFFADSVLRTIGWASTWNDVQEKF
ncbi:unnamed protein product [Amoebophrya sp. A25]|nr:unnamed protein product [Amoebophrya sp. A25]|eukprot:GSA25T00010026001.1